MNPYGPMQQLHALLMDIDYHRLQAALRQERAKMDDWMERHAPEAAR